MPNDADLAVVGMAANAVVMHQEGGKKDHQDHAQHERKHPESERLAIGVLHSESLGY